MALARRTTKRNVSTSRYGGRRMVSDPEMTTMTENDNDDNDDDDDDNDNERQSSKIKSIFFRPMSVIVCSALLLYGIVSTAGNDGTISSVTMMRITSSTTATATTSTATTSTATTMDKMNDHVSKNNKKKQKQQQQQSQEEDIQSLRRAAHDEYRNCTISSFAPPQPPRTDPQTWRKPLWVPGLPASGAASPSNKGDLIKALIDSLTGLSKATKNYHMSMRNKLRRCHGLSETAACTQGHPYVKVGPESQTNNFQSASILVLRNPRDSFPASHTDKNIAYHHASGQAPESQWRKVRDEYYQSAIQTWKEMILWWIGHETSENKNHDYYVALFVPFEHLLHPKKGPILVQKLSTVYQNAGFEVATSTNDISCIWYKAVAPEWKRQDQLTEYVPGYTPNQQQYMLQELQSFIDTIQGLQQQQQQQQQNDNNNKQDYNDLLKILNEYYLDIQHHTRIDEIGGGGGGDEKGG